VARLNVVLKGNFDVHDSLAYSRVNGEIQWNGINALLAEHHPGFIARAYHEPCARWDVLGIEGAKVPIDLDARKLDLGAFTLDVQFRSKLLDHPADVVVLSIQPDVMTQTVRHRREGYEFLPAFNDAWGAEDRRWLDEEFAMVPLSTPAASMKQLSLILRSIRARSSPSVLVFNMSSCIVGDRVTSYSGLEDALSTRIRAFNLALIEIAPELDISIVDVDHIVAQAGATRTKVDATHYTPIGYRLIAAEVLRILEDYGHFDV
jgi:hypothetical protein